MTSDECRQRAEEAQTLAAQTQDDWERELFQRIATQWHVLAIHKKGKEEQRCAGYAAAGSSSALDIQGMNRRRQANGEEKVSRQPRETRRD
jgi:hypothetical protein